VADRARRAGVVAWAAEAVLWVAATVAAWAFLPDRWAAFDTPVAWIAPLVAAIGLLAFPLLLRARRELLSFGASGLAIAGMIGTLGIGLFPNLVPALDTPERSLTIANAASSDLSLGVMLGIAAVGVPIVLAYTAFVYWSMRGKVRLDDAGYGH
jgi:cytochrome d ubiquinol oxidase subunit II